MLTIGILGVTIPGAVDCITKINRLKGSYFRGETHPNILFYQPDFGPMGEALRLQHWDVVLDSLAKSAEKLANAGADFVIVPANTVHKVIHDLQKRSPIPVLNMLEKAASDCAKKSFRKVGIMGTAWTMSGHLYREELAKKGIEEVIPDTQQQQVIQQAIFSELIPTGQVNRQTLSKLVEIVTSLQERGCDGVALACTELPLALNEGNCPIPAIDPTALLAQAALERAL
ncbi:MAG TPA: amino acid racemase [Chlamydiales bacterium]|nr:amino acid racemase [Chlamydiales bacterium]